MGDTTYLTKSGVLHTYHKKKTIKLSATIPVKKPPVQNAPFDKSNNPDGITSAAAFAKATEAQQKNLIHYAKHINLPPNLDNNLVQRVMYVLGSNEPGTVLSDQDFAKFKSQFNGEVFHRYTGSSVSSGQAHIQSEMYAEPQDMYVGGSAAVHGYGTYFAQQRSDASGYGKVKYSMMFTPNAKVLSWNTLGHSRQRDTSSLDRDYKNWATSVGVNPSRQNMPLYAISKGYDAIRALGGNSGSKGHDYIVLLNRKNTVMKKG